MQLHHIFPLVLLPGCFGASALPDFGADAQFGPGPDLTPLCTGNNDGVIEAGELIFPVGASVNYLTNPLNTTVAVDPVGKQTADGPEWDLSSTAGDVQKLTLLDVRGQWFAGSFADATYATTADLGSGTLGIFRVTPDALLLLGFASPDPDRTLLVYDQPVATLRFPLRAGDGWVTGAKITNGKLDGQPFASTDTYRIQVDQRGVADLPYLAFKNTLRVRVDLSQALPAGVASTHIQYLFFHECYGELGRMVSTANEPDPAFQTASEFRRLAL